MSQCSEGLNCCCRLGLVIHAKLNAKRIKKNPEKKVLWNGNESGVLVGDGGIQRVSDHADGVHNYAFLQ